MTTRSTRPSLDGEQFDVVIIGGGINGVAIARECARARKRVLLVEKNDFASGTTSRSTRIIHGGLRYLEHGEIGLVRESLRERERLLATRGHLVRPLNFLLAMPESSSRSALEVRFGLWLYRTFARRAPVRNYADDRRKLENLLDNDQHWSIFAYEDAQCEYPERLTAEWLVAAAALGATIRNHTEALKVQLSNGVVTGVRLRDVFTGFECSVESKCVINATGPWADSLLQHSAIDIEEPLIGGVRGSHILLPLFAGAPKSAVFTEALDGRPIFVIPWAGQLLVGTTEVKDNGDPSRSTPGQDEIGYLLRSFQRLFPSIGYTIEDVRSAFAGVRPLPHLTEKTPNSITRRHFLVDHREDGASGLVSIVGGKLTTAASLARECARAIGIKVPEPKGLGMADALPIDRAGIERLQQEFANSVQLSEKSVHAIGATFNGAAPQIFQLAGKDDSFRQTLCPHTDHLVAEAVYSVHHEHALTLADVLLRRVPVALGPCWSGECAQVAARRIGDSLGWTPNEISTELESFEEEYGRFLQKPARATASQR